MGITGLFKREGGSWLKSILVLVLWILASAKLIQSYGPNFNLALLDSAVQTILIVGGLFLLENVFRFYLPQRSNAWLVIVLPLVMSALALYLGHFGLKQLFSDQTEYLLFLEKSFAVRGAIVLILFSACALLLVIAGRLEDQIKTRQREEMIMKMSKEAELHQLRQQLQPHFLFNSLNSISALIASNPEKAREMIFQLSGFLRGTIRKDEKKWVTVQEEVSYLQLFLDIERVRFGHRLKADFQVEETTQSIKIPQMLLQPLMENAVKHGLYGTMGDVDIQLNIRDVGVYLEMTITNPFDPKAGVSADGLGFGLDAVKRRLYLLFGRHDLLNCGVNQNQFSVVLKIPYVHDPNPHN
ncbi:sensor histidine kinase [Rhodonellum sp.]|uniref:sensor histidine kinase n=1 Tax=Rhodonellum sp. TaxID=2231180 RepID=UPI00271B4336|nr:histidine kinase [Rhodonellum sp.]MDO9551010.1 histidine kinase [Rhodonellum sp.]